MRTLFIAIASVLLAGMTIMSCEEKDDFVPTLLLDVQDAIQVSNRGGEFSIDVLSNLSWEASTTANWITLEESTGEKGKRALSFSVTENENDERSSTITVHSQEGTQAELTVVQESGLTLNIFVKEGAEGSGKSWEDPTNLSNALKLAITGSSIFIAEGHHTPMNIVSGGNSDDPRDRTFEVASNMTLIGGFPAQASSGATPDPDAYPTILSGELSDGNNSYHVVTISAPQSDEEQVVLRGLTISDGQADGSKSSATIQGRDFRREYGGGLIIGGSRVVLENCAVKNNTSDKYVAGVYVFDEAEVTILHSKLNNNASKSNGGGLWANNSTVFAYHSEFNENSGGTAPAVHAYPNAEIYLFNSEIRDNKGRSFGAAFYARADSKGALVNCLVTGNESTSSNGGGGVMMYDNCEMEIISTTITENTIKGPGGGVYRRKGENILSIYNSIISGNTQKEGTMNIDVYESDADPAKILASTSGEVVFDANGQIEEDAAFKAISMLGDDFTPIGDDNPALTYGMTPNHLKEIDYLFPESEKDWLDQDFHGHDRSGSTTMGATLPE